MKFKGSHTGTRRRAAAMAAMVFLCVLLSPACRSCARETEAATMMEAQEKADVRSGPDMQSQALGQLEQGEKIFAVELTEGGWYRVAYQGKTGYVKENCLKIYSISEWDAPENPDATGPSGKIINPEEEYKKLSEAATARKRSIGSTIAVFAGAVLLIGAYSAYVVVKEREKTGKSQEDGESPENIQDGAEAGQEQGNDGMEFLDLEQEDEADRGEQG